MDVPLYNLLLVTINAVPCHYSESFYQCLFSSQLQHHVMMEKSGSALDLITKTVLFQ